MQTLWFILVAFMLTMYVVLDGFDLGAGVIHLFAALDDLERRTILSAIGPVWDGNEVWLIAAGGTIFFTFPVLYASSFSGFYLPLIMVLWFLMLRGVAVELRSHLQNPVWIFFWDGLFFLGSALLAIFYGVALGNVIRSYGDVRGARHDDVRRARSGELALGPLGLRGHPRHRRLGCSQRQATGRRHPAHRRGRRPCLLYTSPSPRD